MFFAAVFVMIAALFWPSRYEPPYPWGESVFVAALWTSMFVIICKPLLREWRFWISLAFGIAVQVWVTKSLIGSGVHMRKATGTLMMFIGMIVWGIAYLLLMQIHKGLGFRRIKNRKRAR